MQLETIELVLPWIFAEGEDGGAAVMDLSGTDTGDDLDNEGGDGGGDDLDGGAAGGEGEEGQQGEKTGEQDKVDGRRGPKEIRDALKALRDNPETAKYFKQISGDVERARELATIEPGGVSAVREKYALLESVGGPEAITTMQERIAEVDATDQLFLAGDAKGLEALGPDFDPGLAKLAPAFLERVMKTNPEAYEAAILPHLMSGLMGSPMVGDLNTMIDVLQAPHLDEKQKIQNITALLGKIGKWFEANEQKAGQLKAKPVDQGQAKLDQDRSAFEQQQQEAHWKNNIQPAVAQYENQKLEELFRPYAAKLGLDAAAKADLFQTFKERLKAAGAADAAHVKQMGIYRKQKNPDAAKVSNAVKNAINRHAPGVVQKAVTARYGKFLGGGGAKKPAVATQQGARAATGGAGTAPVVVSQKPPVEEIDYRATSEADQYKGIYTLKSGKRVQVRKAQ